MQFCTAASNRQRIVTSDTYLEMAFNTLDKNKDGFFTVQGFKSAFGYKNQSPLLKKIQA